MINPTMRTLSLHYFCVTWIVLFILLNSCEVRGNSAGEEFCQLRSEVSNSCPTSEGFYLTWPNQETCKEYDVKVYPDGTFKPTALVSFPFSGLYFLLQMVERSSGILTSRVGAIPPNLRGGSDYNVRCGLRAWDGSTIMQGTYEPIYKLIPKWFVRLMTDQGEDLSWLTMSRVVFNYRGVILVRNPWHALINTREKVRPIIRKCAIGCKQKRGLKESEDFDLDKFQEYFELGAKLWVDSVKRWVTKSPYGSELILVHYETLIQNPEPDVRRILKFLNLTVNEGRLKCALEDPPYFQQHFPDHEPKSIMSYFFENSMDSKASQILEDGMMEINEILRSKGVSEQLNYVKPSPSDILTMKDGYMSRDPLTV